MEYRHSFRGFRLIHTGDALTVLRTLPDESVQCCVTSPPYWGLRDYGTATWAGGDVGCDHKAIGANKTFGNPVFNENRPSRAATDTAGFRDTCGKCGATRIDAQLGLERTPAEYVARMVAVFEEVRRVLRADGTLWLNLGDSYANNPASSVNRNGMTGTLNGGTVDFPVREATRGSQGRSKLPDGLKPKDLIGIPWRVALALQADGWWLRSDIIWAKPNPMPESVTDRPTKSHEYLFLLTKSARYFYDADAIAEPAVIGSTLNQTETTGTKHLQGPRFSGNNGHNLGECTGTRNARTVWTIATSPYPEAHFATFPPEIPRRCILAGSRHGDTVLDPFAGAGTTGLVAYRLGRKFVGIELNPDYVKLTDKRIYDDCPMFYANTVGQNTQ